MNSSLSPEPTTLQRIAAGETEAVDGCLKQYGNLVWSLANRYCRRGEDAEDAVQEIFVEIWRTAERFDPEKASEPTFVSMIARRRLIDRARRRKTKPGEISIGENEIEVPDQVQIDQTELFDEAAKAAGCMKKLSDNQRRILSLSIFQGLQQSVIASSLEMPLGTVKSYARRGLIQLRDCMQRPIPSGADPAVDIGRPSGIAKAAEASQ
ncbi:MAG: sigma-70 family RNA polymerase sigma factor [Planctomycetota bacterium]